MRQPTARRRLPGGGPTPGPADFKLPQLQAGLGLDSRQDSRTAPATSVWPAVADGSPAEHAPQATGGLGGSSSRLGGRRAADPPAAEPRQSSMPRHRRIRTQTEDVRHRQQQPVRTGSAVSQYEQPPEGGSPPGPAGFFHVCQVRRAGPWDTTAAGQPGRTAASVQISTTEFRSEHNQTLPSGGSLPAY